MLSFWYHCMGPKYVVERRFIFASVFGTFVPLTLEKFKIDPALATGPFISITNDIIGMLIYMLVSSALIESLG